MLAVRFNATTDGSGAAAQTLSAPGVMAIYAVEWDGSALTGGTLALSVPDAPNGATTLFSLAAANVKSVYYPRTSEHTTAGVAASTTTYSLVNGSLKIAVAGGGATKTVNCVVYLLEAI